MPSYLNTSTMKSDPGRSTIWTSATEVSAARCAALGGGTCVEGGCCALPRGGVAATAAPIAAPFKNPRRATETFLDFAIPHIMSIVVACSNPGWHFRASGSDLPVHDFRKVSKALFANPFIIEAALIYEPSTLMVRVSPNYA